MVVASIIFVVVTKCLLCCRCAQPGDKHNYNAECDDDEFMVAADFTLYSNPINRALYRPLQTALPANQPLVQLPAPPTTTTSTHSLPPSGTVAVSTDSKPVIRNLAAVAV